MKEKEYGDAEERNALVAMVANDTVCGSITARWDQGGHFSSSTLNRLGQWCVDHYKKYGKAPRHSIVERFERWAAHARDAEKEATERYLQFMDQNESYSLNGEINPQYSLDRIGETFNKVRYARLFEAGTDDLAAGALDKAVEKVDSFRKFEVGTDNVINLADKEVAMATFVKEEEKSLIHYKGDLKIWYQNQLERGAFVSFLAQQKMGKSFWLLDVAWRAAMQGRRTAYLQVGDLSREDLQDRFYTRAAKHPSYSNNGEWPYTVNYPTFVNYRPDARAEADKVQVKHKQMIFEAPLDGEAAWKAYHKVMKDKDCLKLSSHANLSISAAGLRTQIDSWCKAGWVPDVVVIDYADNLLSVSKLKNKWDEVNHTWALLRAMAHEYHCLVVTATQANREARKAKVLYKEHISEADSKMNHVTAMIGINVLAHEKRLGLHRLNYLAKRKGASDPTEMILVASCIPIANPAVMAVL